MPPSISLVGCFSEIVRNEGNTLRTEEITKYSMKLLIVDDHAGVRKLIRELVGHRSTEIRECTDGEDALRLCAEDCPDFVIMDLQMPGLDGFETTRRLVAEYPRLRVIAISHLKHPDIEERARKAGAFHFVRKENLFDLARFLGRISNM